MPSLTVAVRATPEADQLIASLVDSATVDQLLLFGNWTLEVGSCEVSHCASGARDERPLTIAFCQDVAARLHRIGQRDFCRACLHVFREHRPVIDDQVDAIDVS